MMKRSPSLLAALAAALLLFQTALPAQAAGAKAKPASLTDSQKTEVGRAETYLNDMRTLKARFLQSAPDGSFAQGTFYLSRPGKLRLEYDPPNPMLIIGTGHLLVYHDTQLKQTSQMPIDSSPAGILVRQKIDLTGADVTVTDFAQKSGLTHITLAQTDDPQAGSITLIFTREPYQLRQWIVRDPQGQFTTITLSDAHPGIAMDQKLFVFNDPNEVAPSQRNLQ
ncbi:putative outer-membrane lipoprotein carrier protein [Rhodospirillaceae bacterium LM-1]|nr:putative outer-membrane lipoprotein carrier protein [Rhodospirillaceae bacterium LM-1]